MIQRLARQTSADFNERDAPDGRARIAISLRARSGAVAVLMMPLLIAAGAIDSSMELPRAIYIVILVLWGAVGIVHGVSIAALVAARPPEVRLAGRISRANRRARAVLRRLTLQVWKRAQDWGAEPAVSAYAVGTALGLVAWVAGLFSGLALALALLVSAAAAVALAAGPPAIALLRLANRGVDVVLLCVLVAAFALSGAGLGATWQLTGSRSFFATMAEINATFLLASMVVLYAPGAWRRSIRHRRTWFAVAPISALIGLAAALIGQLTMTDSGVLVGLSVAALVPATCALLVSSSIAFERRQSH